MKRILILGAGKFGLQAAVKLSKNDKNRITVVDDDPGRCKTVAAAGLDAVCTDSILFLAESLKSLDPPDWIVPAVPLHVVLEWLRTTLPPDTALETAAVPESVIRALPNPMVGGQGQVYSSYADFICPEDCPEPAASCTFTGKARQGVLYKTLGEISGETCGSVVVRSRQLAPGVGGYRPDDLFTALSGVLSNSGPVLLSTACKCHGVTHLVSVNGKGATGSMKSRQNRRG